MGNKTKDYLMKRLLCVLSLSAILTSSAFADVCGIVTREQAERSLSVLTKGTKIEMTYSDIAKTTVKTVSVTPYTEMEGVEYFDLKVNGVSIDPGHTNVVINKNVSLNLGRIVGCDKDASDPDFVVGTAF
jgi:hypothetical protein